MYCDFTGSYYDPAPWDERACAQEAIVPAGCPIHFTDASLLDPATITASVVAMDGTRTPIGSTASVAATDTQTFSVMDVDSCDCHFTNITLTFRELAVDVPTAQPGDLVVIEPYAIEATIGPAGTCPTPDWPNQYNVGFACDRCTDPVDSQDDDDGGCTVGGDPSLALAALGLVPLLRRFSRRTRC